VQIRQQLARLEIPFQVLEIVMVILVPERVVSFSEGVLLSTWVVKIQKVHLWGEGGAAHLG
jgi:hypothetical protein